MNDHENEVIYVSTKHLGLIIGKGGATIKEISQETGCRINIKKDDAANDEVPVTLEGSLRNIEAAKTKINEITRRQHKRHQPDGDDNRYGNNGNDRNFSDNSSKRPSRRDDDDNRSYRRSSNDQDFSRNGDDDKYNKSSNDRDYNRNDNCNGYNSHSSNSNNGYGRSNNSYDNNSSWSRGRSDNNHRQPVNDDHWGGWGSNAREQDTVDSLIFRGDDNLRGNTKYLQQSSDNYVPDDDWGIPSCMDDETPVRKRPGNAQLKMRSNKDKTFFQVLRNFYVEHPDVASMTTEEKDTFLVAKNNIMIKEIDAAKDSYCNFGGGLEDDPEDSIEIIPVPKIVPNPVRSFDEAFYRYPDILKEIRKQKFLEPSPIQCIGWPILMAGRDLIGIAQTGTGKTLAFLLPAFIHIEGQPKPRENRQGPTVLILSPTRELAIQIQKEVQKYTYHDIDSVVCYGGADKREQINQLKEFPEIVVGTPGRILDLKDSGILNLKDVSYLVLDEADRMLDMGFEIQVVNIIYSVRKQRQTVMTSATWPFSVQRIALNHMKDPIQVNVGTLDLNACHSVTQHVEYVEFHDKTRRLVEILSEIQPDDKIIIFVARKAQCSDLAYELHEKRSKGQLGPKGAVRACEIHGDLDQQERELALRMMRSGARNVLIATDVASRGLDIPDLTKVINFDFPKNIEEYVHRVGRTGRAGRTGISITFMNKRDWSGVAELIKILEDADQEVPDFLPPLMKQYQEFRINGGSRGRFGGGRGGGGRGGGRGFGRGGGGGGRNRRGGDDDDDSFFGRGYEADDVKSDSSYYTDNESVDLSVSLLSSDTTNDNITKCYNIDDSSNDENWGKWNVESEKFCAETTFDLSKLSISRTADALLSPGKRRYNLTKIVNTENSPYIVRNKDQNMYPIIRNFYREHPVIETLNHDDLEQQIKQKYNLIIQELKTYPAHFNVNHDEDDDDDDHFDENKVPFMSAICGIPKTVRSFDEAFWQYPDILTILQYQFTEPTSIQRIGWPTLLGGRDFICMAKTGTGKTLTYALPALVHIDGQTKQRIYRRGPTALIVTATKKLGKKIESQMSEIRYSDIKYLCCLDEPNKLNYTEQLRCNPELIIGTAGILDNLMSAGLLCLIDVSYLVLDDIDTILDTGFEAQLIKIINRTRKHRQTVLTSSTWSDCVQMIALMYMNNPVQVSVSSSNVIACKNVVQELRHVENFHKTTQLCDIISSLSMYDKLVVFVTRKRQCRSLVNIMNEMIHLNQLGPYASVCEIHGDLEPEKIVESLEYFYGGRCNILITTNMASKELDLSQVTCVVNYDFPTNIEQYVHRVSIIGRIGSQCKVITFLNDMNWKHSVELQNVLKQLKQTVPEWLRDLRSMKPTNIDDCKEDTKSYKLTDETRVCQLRHRFSDDSSCSIGSEGGGGNKVPVTVGRHKVVVTETIIEYHRDCWQELLLDGEEEGQRCDRRSPKAAMERYDSWW